MAPFKWVNTTLGNIKCAITGTYRKLGPDHRYLASFAWRYNRRYQLQTMIPRFVIAPHAPSPCPIASSLPVLKNNMEQRKGALKHIVDVEYRRLSDSVEGFRNNILPPLRDQGDVDNVFDRGLAAACCRHHWGDC